jgi:serine/threonine-protein kinase
MVVREGSDAAPRLRWQPLIVRGSVKFVLLRSERPARVGRYEVHGEIGSGGMATVYYGRLSGPFGFGRTVAIKRMHAHLAKEPEFRRMFADEVRLAARVQHPNVVNVLDVVLEQGEAFLVMEYVAGVALARLMSAARDEEEPVPPGIAVGIVCGLLHGLHAAHEATGQGGEPLHIVHRDVSPQNVLIGVEGVPRLIDFGVAKAVGRLQTTVEGHIKGKIGYMPPEQVWDKEIDRRADVYAAGVVLWELLTGRKLVKVADNQIASMLQMLEARIEPPCATRPDLPADLNAAVMRALSYERTQRFATARQMAATLEASMPVAGALEIGEWARRLAGRALAERASSIASMESGAASEIVTHPERSRSHGDDGSQSARRRRRRATPASVVIGVGAACAVGLAVGGALAHKGASVRAAVPPSNDLALGAPSRADETPSPPPATLSPSEGDRFPLDPSLEAPASAGVAATRETPPVDAPARPPAPSRSRPRAGVGRSAAAAGCRVEQFTDSKGFVHFRCAR